jgi:hypothetical protein
MKLAKLKKQIEKSVLAVATSKNNKPHQIAIACVKVLGNNLIITDNFMKETRKNIKSNNKVSLIFWKNKGYELRGNAKYYSSGKWLNFVRNLKENKGFKPKGAVVVKIKEIKESR